MNSSVSLFRIFAKYDHNLTTTTTAVLRNVHTKHKQLERKNTSPRTSRNHADRPILSHSCEIGQNRGALYDNGFQQTGPEIQLRLEIEGFTY